MNSLGIDIGGSSIKLAVRREGETVCTRRSKTYVRPGRAELIAYLRDLIGDAAKEVDQIGLCAPGLLDRDSRCVTHAVNLPCLDGELLDELLSEATETIFPPAALLTDAEAAALDIYVSRSISGRLFLLVLGTGIGAAVRDAAGPLRVDGESPGHFGQIDVTLPGELVLGPDDGAGGLEGYLGAAALRQRYGDSFLTTLATIPMTAPPLAALVRAIRIGHAIYRPHHVCIAGGIGNALVPRLAELRQSIHTHLTRIARTDWTLTCGDSDFHAALGAARLAEKNG